MKDSYFDNTTRFFPATFSEMRTVAGIFGMITTHWF